MSAFRLESCLFLIESKSLFARCLQIQDAQVEVGQSSQGQSIEARSYSWSSFQHIVDRRQCVGTMQLDRSHVPSWPVPPARLFPMCFVPRLH